jgi:hypothetical protein
MIARRKIGDVVMQDISTYDYKNMLGRIEKNIFRNERFEPES